MNISNKNEKCMSCPRCSAKTVIKYGRQISNKRQRYCCKCCNKVFSIPKYIKYLHKSHEEKFINHLKELIRGTKLENIVQDYDISYKCAHRWRIKFFYLLDNYCKKPMLDGTIELDEQYFNLVTKGRWGSELPMIIKNIDSENPKKGLSKDKACVCVAISHDNEIRSEYMCRGKVDIVSCKKFIENSIGDIKHATLITDGDKCYKACSKIFGFKHVVVDAKTHKSSDPDKFTNINKVNSVHSVYRSMNRMCRGISTKYLNSYFNKYNLFKRLKQEQNKIEYSTKAIKEFGRFTPSYANISNYYHNRYDYII